MHWNEKIDLLKKKYSEEAFSVPHLDRKDILRKIETRFISRPQHYYDLNNFNERFCNWWDHIKSSIDLTIEADLQTFLNNVIDPNEQFWIAGEFSDGIMIYKSKLNAILHLISIGQTCTHTFHIIQLKYACLVSLRIEEAEISIKASGSNEFQERIKRATALCIKS